MKMYSDEKTQGLQRMSSFIELFDIMCFFRPTSGHETYQMKRKR